MKKTYLKVIIAVILLVTMGLAVFLMCREPNYVMANEIVGSDTYYLDSITKVNKFDKTMGDIYTSCYNSSKPSDVSDYKKAETISICSQEELFQFAKLVNEKSLTFEYKTVYLISDIDMENKSWTPIAGDEVLIGNISNGFLASKGFKGGFNGQGHKISNLNVETSGCPAGFFGFLPSASAGVSNIIFDNPTIISKCTSTDMFNCAGVVVGASSGNVINCVAYKANVSVKVSSACDSAYDRIAAAGGIVGKRFNNAQIIGCSFNGNVKVNTNQSHYGAAVGGICGYVTSSFVYILGEVTGIIDYSSSDSLEVKDCYANADFSVSISDKNCGLYINTIDIFAKNCVGVLTCTDTIFNWHMSNTWYYSKLQTFEGAGTNKNAEWVIDGYGCNYNNKTLRQLVKYSDCKFYNATIRDDEGDYLIDEAVMKQSCEDIFGDGINTKPFVKSLCGDDDTKTSYSWQQDAKIFIINTNGGSVNGKTSVYRVVKDLYTSSSINKLAYGSWWYPQYMPLNVSLVPYLGLETVEYKLSNLGLGTPTWSGHRFAGWKITDGTTETEIKAGDDYTFGGKVSYTLTAQWKDNIPTLTVVHKYINNVTGLQTSEEEQIQKSGSTYTVALKAKEEYDYSSFELSGTGSIGSYDATTNIYTYGADDATLTLIYNAKQYRFNLYFNKSYVNYDFLASLAENISGSEITSTSSNYVLKIPYTTDMNLFKQLTSENLNTVLNSTYINTHVFDEINTDSEGKGNTISSMAHIKEYASGSSTSGGITTLITTAYVIYKEKPTDITAVLHYNNSQFYVSNSLETSERDEPCTKTITISRTNVLNSLKPYNLRETDYEKGKPEHGNYFWGWTTTDHGYSVASPKTITDWVKSDTNITGDTAHFYAVWSTTPITMKVVYDSTLVTSAPTITNNTYSAANPIYTDDKNGNISIWANYGEQVTVGDVTLTATASQTKKFTGWHLAGNKTEGTEYSEGVITFGRGELTLTAIIEDKGQITVTLDYQGATGGNGLKYITAKEGGMYDNLPEKPTKSNSNGDYTFKGWFTSSTDGTEIKNGMNLVSNSDHTLYAQWQDPGSYNYVTFNIFTPSSYRFDLSDLIESITVRTLNNKYITVDYTSPELKTKDYSKTVSIPSGSGVTFYVNARENVYCEVWSDYWEGNAYITQNLNKDLRFAIYVTVDYMDSIAFQDYNPSGRTEYIDFVCIDRSEEYSWQTFATGFHCTKRIKEDGYYDANGRQYYNYKDSHRFNEYFDENFTDFLCPKNLTANNLIRGDKIFQGYYFDSDFSGPVVTWDTHIYNQAKGKYPTEDIYLYAKWVSAAMTVTMDANDGTIGASENWTGSGATATKEVKYKDTLGALPSPKTSTLSRSYYTFAGWYYDEAFTQPVSDSDDFQEKISAGENEITIYAKWVNYEYTVKYDDNDDYMSDVIKGGNSVHGGTMADSTFWTNETYNLSKNEYTRAYYTFVGWNTKPDGSGRSYSDERSIRNLWADGVTEGTLYAQWDRISYDIELKIEPAGHGHLVVTIYDYQAGKYVSPISADGTYSADTVHRYINSVLKEVVELTITEDTTITTYAGNTITVTAVDQTDVIASGAFRDSKKDYLGYLFTSYQTALSNSVSDKVLTLPYINADGTVTATYGIVQYTMALSVVYGDEKASTVTSGKLTVNPALSANDTVTLSLTSPAVTAEYIANIGYIRAIDDDGTCWYYYYNGDTRYELSNDTDTFEYVLTIDELIAYYDTMGSAWSNYASEAFAQKTQNLADVYINTRKMVIDLTFTYVDIYNADTDSSELANSISIATTVNEADVTTVSLDDILSFTVTDVKNYYKFYTWGLKTASGGDYYTATTTEKREIKISTNVIKYCATDLVSGESGHDAKLVFEISMYRPILVMVDVDNNVIKGGVYSRFHYYRNYNARYGETLHFGFVLRTGYELTGIRYRTKSYTDSDWSEYTSVSVTDGEITLDVTADMYEIEPTYDSLTFTVDIKVYVGNTSYAYSEWTDVDLLTCGVTPGENYPRYEGYFTLAYELKDTANYSMVGLFAGLDGAKGTAIYTGQTYSATRAIKDGYEFSIVLSPISDTVIVCAIQSESDLVNGRWTETENPAEYSLQSGTVSGEMLTLSTGDEFTLNYDTYKGYNIVGYKLNNGPITSLTQRSGSIPFVYSSDTKGTYYLIFSKVQYTLIVANDDTKGEYTADKETIYINQTFNLSGTDYTGYRNVGFVANTVEFEQMADVTVTSDMISDDTTDTLTITPKYIAQYTVSLDIRQKYLASSVQTYIDDEESDFSRYYDEGTTVKIELVTDLDHEIAKYIDITDSEISVVSDVENDTKTYTISFRLYRDRYIILTLDGVEHVITVYNDMASGSVTFNTADISDSDIMTLDDRYEVTVRYGETLGMLVTAYTGYRYDGITADEGEFAVPFEVTSDQALTVHYVKTYILTTAVAGIGIGTITDGGEYDVGTALTVTATPDTGYYLSKWVVNGEDVYDLREYIFEINENTTVTAYFEYIEYTFDTSALESYYVVGFTDSKESYHFGETVDITLTARTAVHFELRKILVNNVPYSTETVDNAIHMSLKVNYVNFNSENKCVITASVYMLYSVVVEIDDMYKDWVSILAENVYTHLDGSYEYILRSNGRMTITVTGSEYFTFDHMDINEVQSTANPYYLSNLTENKTISVVMNRTTAKISVVAKTLLDGEYVDNTEVIDVTAPNTALVYDEVTVTINADIVGYRFEYFYYGEILDLTDDSSTFVVDRPSTCEVYAVFSYLDYVVLYSEDEHYTVTSTTSTTAHKYDTLTMVISPDSGYQVVGWVFNGESIESAENEYSCVFEPTDNDVSKAYIIAPIVEKIKYTVTATTNNNTTFCRGTVSITYNGETHVPTAETPDPTVDVEYGDSVTLTATVNDDSKYRFIKWMYNDEIYSYSDIITIKKMNENKAGEYMALFSTATDTITVQVTPDHAYAGRITKYVNGEQTTDFQNGDTVTMSIDESKITTGYAFVGWHINELKPSPDYTTTELTITLTKDNRVLGGVIYAQFAPRDYKIAIDWSAGGAVDYTNKDGSVNGYQPSTDVYDMYDELTLSISSDAGYRIGNIIITNGMNTVTISDYVNSIYGVWTLDFNTILRIYSEEITTIYVDFEIMHFDIVTSLVITNGDHYDAMILPEPTTVDYGQSFDISTVLAEGFNFVGWYVGDTMITNIKDYTLSASYIYNMYVEENGRNVLYLVAKCEYIVYDLQDNFVKRLIEDDNIVVPSITPGVITISQDGMYRLNDSISMSVTASTGYRLVGIYVDGELVTNESTYTTVFAVDMQDSIFEARFEKILVTISVTAVSTDGTVLEDHGDILILDGDVVGNGFYYQDTVTILASANYGYTFAKYSVLGVDHTGSHYQYMDKDYLAYTFVISDAHMDALTDGALDVQAIYQIMVFTITFESNMSVDSISLGIVYNGAQYTQSVQAQYNTEVTLTAVCSDNLFKLLGIYLGDEWLSGNEEYSFTVKRNMNIVAKFGPVISFANFTDPEQRLYEREYNFAEQRLEIGTDILCHPNYINYLIVNYEKLDAGIVDPINAGEYIVTVKIGLTEYADFISDPVRLRINKYALNVEMTDAVTKTYDGTCNVSKSTLESVLVLNGLPAEHADATALDFETVIAKLMKNNLEYKKVATGLDLKVTGLTLTDSDNFYIIDTDGYLMFNACGSITPKVLTLQGVTILNKVYDGTDIAMVSSDTTPYIMSSEIITDDQLSLDVDNIIYRYEDAEVGSNKRVRGEAGLLGLARENYRLEIFDQTANIHPYEIHTTVGGVTYTVTDTNRDVFLPIGGTLDVTVYERNTAKYRELYAVIDSIVNRRNKFLVAYDIVIMSDSGVFVPAKPIQVTFALPFKADSRVHSYLVNTQYQSLVNAVDNNTISITATDMVSIAITKEREFLPTWLIIVIISAGMVLLAGGVTIIVVLSKRRQRTTLLRESMRFSDF